MPIASTTEFIVNDNPAGSQDSPSIAMLADGRVVVVWASDDGAPDDNVQGSIRFKIYSPDGAVEYQGEAAANSTTALDQLKPSVTALANGTFVVAWMSEIAGSNAEARARVFDVGGTPLGNDFSVGSAGDLGGNTPPAIAALPNGGFAVYWTTPGPALDTEIEVRSFFQDGTSNGGVLSVSALDHDAEGMVNVAVLANGRTAIAYAAFDVTPGTTQRDIYLDFMDEEGVLTPAAPVVVNVSTDGQQLDPSIAALADGRVVVAWQDTDPAVDTIRYRIMDPGGVNHSGQFTVPTTIADVGSDRSDPAVLGLADGRFIIVWSTTSTLFDGAGGALRGQLFESNGAAIGAAFNVSGTESALGTPHRPELTALADGGFAVAWDNDVGDGSGSTVYTRVFNPLEFNGTAGVDTWVGGAFADRIIGLGGDDDLEGRGGNDIISGDDGADTIFGGDGNDTIYGGLGDDTQLRGNANDDRIFGGEGVDSLYGDGGNDVLDGGNGGDELYGNANNDILIGGAGDDSLVGGAGTDQMRGGTGADGLFISVGDDVGDVYDGGDDIATDTLAVGYLAFAAYAFDLRDDLLIDIEVLRLLTPGAGLNAVARVRADQADLLTGFTGTTNAIDRFEITMGALTALSLQGVTLTDLNQANDAFVIVGDANLETIHGSEVNDIFNTGAGNDQLFGHNGNDTYNLANFITQISEANGEAGGIDAITSTITRTLQVNVENLTLLAGGGAISGFGNSGNNTITGNASANGLAGGAGTDTLIGGGGNDTYTVDLLDTVTELAGGGIDLVLFNGTTGNVLNLWNQVDNLTLTGAFAVHANGNGLNNVITGNSNSNTLNGMGGADTFIGSLARDTLTGGAANDIFRYTASGQSGVGALSDVITDFDRAGMGDDRIDLSALLGPALVYRHNGAFTAAGQVRIVDVAGPDVVVEVNLAGASGAEMQIRLTNTTLASMAATDFIL